MKDVIINFIMMILLSFAGIMAYSFYKWKNNENEYFIVAKHLAIHQLVDSGCEHLEGIEEWHI